jgi:hypothetical protein
MKCDRCRRETGKEAERRVGASFNSVIGKEVLIPYTLPLYCDDCQEDLKALEADITALALHRLGVVPWVGMANETTEVQSQGC